MKKKILLIMVIALSVLCVGCSKEDIFNYEIQKLEQDKTNLEQIKIQLQEEIEELQKVVIDEKINKGMETYLVTLNIKQSHFSLDISDHIKDDMNALEITIPVSKEYYESVSVGQVIDDTFRAGSFLMKGSMGSWKITISNKSIE